MRFRSCRTLLAAVVVAVSPFATVHAQTSAPAPVRIRGEVVSIDAATLIVHRPNADDVRIDLKPDVAVGAVKNVKLADVKSGAYVGAASVPDANGNQVAREVLVFPEAMRGNSEGHYDWDLLPGSKMTNANVDTVVDRSDGRTLTLSYKGGTKTVVVPAGVPVVTFTDATRADIQPGRKVFVIASSSGANRYEARRVIVEKDGVAPPM